MRTIAILVSAAISAAAPSPTAVSEKERGDRLAANGDAAGALEAYQTALKQSPGYAGALNGLGVVLVGQDKKDEAISAFQKAIAADPSLALPYNNVGYLYRKANRWPEAVQAYTKYVELEPKDAAGLFGLAEAHKGAGDKARALATYEKYLEKDTDGSNKKRIEKAKGFVEALRKEVAAAPAAAVSTAPAAAPAAAAAPVAATTPAAAPVSSPVGSGMASAAAGASPAASPTVAPSGAPTPATMAVAPERAAYSKQRLAAGMAMRSAGKTRDALFAIQDAANTDPTNAQAVFELGVSYAMVNYFPQAIERWQRVLAMPVDAAIKHQAQQNIDRARQKMGTAGSATAVDSPQAAVAAASGATATPASSTAGGTSAASSTSAATDASSPGALPVGAQNAYNEGVQLYTQQRYPDAVQAFSKAIQAKAEFPQAYAARGSAYYAQRDFANALNDYGQSMRLDNRLAAPVFGVAEALNALGRKDDAVPYYEAYAASQSPDAQAGLQELARKRVAEIRR